MSTPEMRLASLRVESSRLRSAKPMALVLTVTALVASLFSPGSAGAHTAARDEPLVLVHGIQLFGSGYSCIDQFGHPDEGGMRKALRGWGWTRSIYAVGYYEGDRECDATINNDGVHNRHWGDAAGHGANDGHNANTRIEHLGYHLAWDIYNRYTSKGYTIDLFGHSMGGLIIRYAIAQVQRRDPDFPSALWVEDAVTAGTPHGGARFYPNGCGAVQCRQMNPGDPFLVWLENNAWEPDGTNYGGTDWSSFGSDDDNWVAADRATGTTQQPGETRYFGSCHKIWYTTQANVEHDTFKTDVSTAIDHEVYKIPTTLCATGWTFDSTYYHPVRAADQALMLPDR